MRKKKISSKSITLQMLKKACPAEFTRLPAPEVTPRYVSFQVPLESYSTIRKWLDLGLHLEVSTGPKNNHCQLYILNNEAVHEYNKGRDPSKGYPKNWKQ